MEPSGWLILVINKIFAEEINPIHAVPDLARSYKTFSCSTQLSTKSQLLVKTKIPANKEVSCFKSLRCCTGI